MPQIRLEQVSKYYQQEKKAVPAVREIDLTIEQQEFVFVTGSSGAGKSTLLNLIAGEITPTAGAVYLDVEKRYPVELSLGECRRVELARAIINSPSVLVLDELTASLDEDTIWDLFHLIGELNRLGTTVIMATHAKNFVNLMRKRVITLVDGRIFGDVRNGRYGDVM